LWSDEQRYKQLSARALEYAARPEMNTDRQISLLIDALERFSAPPVSPTSRSARQKST